MKILFNLISGQIFPNYFLIKKINPDRCINFYTTMSSTQKELFKKILEGIELEEVDIDAFNFKNCYETINKVIKRYENDSLILNFTGGTKIMSNAAFMAFQEKKLKTIYLDSQNGKLISISGETQEEEVFQYNVSVEEYFGLTGQSIRQSKPDIESNKEDNKNRERFISYMEKNYPNINNLFIQLAVKSDSAKKKWRKEDSKLLDSNGNILNYTAADKKYEITTKDGNKFILLGDDAFYFITGGWMEKIVYDKIKNSNKFNEVKVNLTLEWNIESKKKNIKNEFDIVATKNHILYIFEVKSGGLSSDIILKLNSINNFYGGLYSKSYIVTYFDFEKDYQDLLSRAKEYNIKILRLSDLNNYLRNEI